MGLEATVAMSSVSPGYYCYVSCQVTGACVVRAAIGAALLGLATGAVLATVARPSEL